MEIKQSKNTLVIVSLRLPVSVNKVDGKLVIKASDGGLATGMSTVSKSRDSVWVGWPGISSEELSAKEKLEITKELKKHKCHPIFLSEEEVDNYYSGFSNSTIWPLFHYFTDMASYDDKFWDAYQRVNRRFSTEIKKFVAKNTQVWVHDYQLMLLPEMIRSSRPDALIGFFLHTPFPSSEIFRLLPQRTEILEGLLGADLVGFHTYDYVSHFLSSVSRTLGYENELGVIDTKERLVKTDSFPIGINYKKFSQEPKKRSVRKIIKSLDVYGKNTKVILTIDRTDYSKGIPARLDAFELFLEQNPKFIKKVALIMLAVPTREDVEAYQELRQTIEQKVSRINGRFATANWSPIVYRYQSLPFPEVSALYAKADVMLVTPLRDGMNLVAKEYVATHHKHKGVLVLSEVAGAASELTEAVQVNPNDTQMVADAIVEALEMPVKEQKARMTSMQKRIATYDINHWAQDYIRELELTHIKNAKHKKQLTESGINKLIKDYDASSNRLILLDYDGTLKSFVSSPDRALAAPSAKVKKVIKQLTNDPNNKVVIVSGRPKSALESFFKNKGLGLVAEHGGWIFDAGRWVKSEVTTKKWKKPVVQLLEQYTTRTPGSVLEEKNFSIVWHYRNVSPNMAYVRKEELKTELTNLLEDYDVAVHEGEKMLEVKPRTINKGAIATELLAKGVWDFVMCIGDDYTDEDMFRALPEKAYSIHVGSGTTDANYQLEKVKDVIDLLNKLN